jgi:hypothetical protein
MRRHDRGNAIDCRLVIEQNIAAAIHLQVNETGRQPNTCRQTPYFSRTGHIPARDDGDDAAVINHNRMIGV